MIMMMTVSGSLMKMRVPRSIVIVAQVGLLLDLYLFFIAQQLLTWVACSAAGKRKMHWMLTMTPTVSAVAKLVKRVSI